MVSVDRQRAALHEGSELSEAEFNADCRSGLAGRQMAEREADALDRLADAGHFVCADVIWR